MRDNHLHERDQHREVRANQAAAFDSQWQRRPAGLSTVFAPVLGHVCCSMVNGVPSISICWTTRGYVWLSRNRPRLLVALCGERVAEGRMRGGASLFTFIL